MRFLITYFFYIFPFCFFAQNKNVVSKVLVTENAVLLRWAPANKQVFDISLKQGYIIERAVVADSLSVPIFNFTLTANPIKPMDASDAQWKMLMEKDKRTGFVYNTLYQKPSGKNISAADKKKSDEMNFGLFLLSCDLSADLAGAAGLIFKDSLISADKKYVYRISVAGLSQLEKNFSTQLFVDASESVQLLAIEDLKGKFSDRTVELSWEVLKFQQLYAAYIIERSEDSLVYSPINSSYVLLTSQYEKEKTKAVFKDSLPQNGKHYYYRIKGLTHFGVVGFASNVIKGKGKTKLNYNPLLDTAYAVNNKIVYLKWKMPSEFDFYQLKGYMVVRAEKDNGVYRLLNSKLISTNFYTDSTPSFSNYYKILAVNTDDDTASSFSWLVQLTDNDPPQVPKGLSGIIDTNGLVHLSWQPNKEKDLRGYRIFRCNSSKEDPVEITKRIVGDTIFSDTVFINTLTENVFYTATAVDSFFNNSDYAPLIKLKRPDIIPPVPPVITGIVINDTSVVVKWINSSSEDALKYILKRTDVTSQNTDTVLMYLVIDDLKIFEDKKIEYEKVYYYTLEVHDDAGNVSTAVSNHIVFEPGVRPAIKNISAKANYDNKLIDINWIYNYTGIHSYTIYKAAKGEQLRVYKTISGEVGKFQDKDVKTNNIYLYQFKATFNSGAKSMISRVVEVAY